MSEKDMKIQPVAQEVSDEDLKNVSGGRIDCSNADCHCLWTDNS